MAYEIQDPGYSTFHVAHAGAARVHVARFRGFAGLAVAVVVMAAVDSTVWGIVVIFGVVGAGGGGTATRMLGCVAGSSVAVSCVLVSA